jgi:surfactin synthase thioesterase subunit
MISGHAAPPASGPILIRIGSRADPACRLVCVPYAGAGTAAYRMFAQALPPWLEVWAVRLPARESRLHEEPLVDVTAVVDTLAAEFTGAGPFGPAGDGLPFALFGHSMGALICFELARELRRRGLTEPAHLFVAGRRAPQIPDDLPAIHRLPRADFIAAVRRLGGMPDEILAEPGLIDLIAPALRADFAVCESYEHVAEPPLGYPISAFGGRADPTTTAERLACWASQTTAMFTMRLYHGDHFFIHTHRQPVLAAVCADLSGAAAPAGRLDGDG